MRPRRSLAFLLALLVVTAGCAAFSPDDEQSDEPQVIRSVVVANQDNSTHTVDVLITHNDSIVYWTSRTIRGRERVGRYDVIHSAEIAPPVLVNTTRRYTVFLRLNNRTTGVRYNLSRNRLNDCYSIRSVIHDGELSGPGISHWNDELYNFCSDPSTAEATAA